MLEGNLVNLRVVEKEGLELCAEWLNNPEVSGEYKSFMQISKVKIEKIYDSFHSEEKRDIKELLDFC